MKKKQFDFHLLIKHAFCCCCCYFMIPLHFFNKNVTFFFLCFENCGKFKVNKYRSGMQQRLLWEQHKYVYMCVCVRAYAIRLQVVNVFDATIFIFDALKLQARTCKAKIAR